MSEYWISAEWLQRLAGSLLHFVWQGALLALAAAILLRVLAHRPASWRYAAAVVFMCLMILAPCGTIFFYPETGAIALRVLRVLRATGGDVGSVADTASVAQWTGWIVLAWAAGVTMCSFRLIGAWILSLRLTSVQAAVPQAVTRILDHAQSVLLATRKAPRVVLGERVTGPMVFGWLRPVVLLPASVVTGLTEEQLLAVLAHELAHIRRHDFLVNALQSVVEAVLFYHPAVWWLSARIRAEREHCCDDLALSVSGDRFAYAEALIELERLRSEILALAVPATGNLTERIRRLLGDKSSNRDWQPAMAALLLLGICALAGLWQPGPMVPPAYAAPLQVPALAAIMTPPALPSSMPARGALGAIEAIATAQTSQAPAAGEHWITTWGDSFLADDYYSTNHGAEKVLPVVECCNDQTVRMFMRVSAGGNSIRVRLSNSYGSAPLFLGQVHIGLHDRGSEIVTGTGRQVLFGGRPSVEIPIGGFVTSDPVKLDVPSLATVAVSIYAPNDTGGLTSIETKHKGYVVSGDQARLQGLTGARLTPYRYWVSGIEVLASANAGTIVVAGDWTTDSESTHGWAGILASRLQANTATKNLAVVTISNAPRLLSTSRNPSFVDLGIAEQTGARYFMLCLDFPTLVKLGTDNRTIQVYPDLSVQDRILKILKGAADAARSRGISTVACTLPPASARGMNLSREPNGDLVFLRNGNIRELIKPIRIAVNEWIKSPGTFAGVADFDAMTRDPANPENLKAEFRTNANANAPEYGAPFAPLGSSPPQFNELAIKAVGDAIDLSLFSRQ